MRAGGRLRGIRTISLALVAGLFAFETILALSARAVGIPGLVLIALNGGNPADLKDGRTVTEGGESDVAKLSTASDRPHQTPVDDSAARQTSGPQTGPPRLYHFEFWLEPPDQLRRRVVAVVYEFNTPAVMPQTQVSSEQKSGFRVSAGGLACADKVTITLKFDDGRTEQVAVDGCKLLS